MGSEATSGIFVRLEIHIDKQSIPNDAFAFGACISELEREGWVLDSFGPTNDGGFVAVVSRSWRIGIAPTGIAKPSAITGGETREPS